MIKFSDHLRTNQILDVPYRGKVVFNKDPRRLGRVKVQIEGVLEDPVIDNLPWVYSKNSTALGGRTDSSSFAAPEIGTELIIEFPYGDIYSGFYVGFWQSESTHQGYLDEDYPSSYGFRDTQNTFLKINKAKKILEFQHASGARFTIDSDSTIEMMSDKAIRFTSKDKKTVFEFNMDTGELILAPKAGLELSGQKLTLKPKEMNVEAGFLNETISGGRETRISGGMKTVVGAGLSESILSSRAESVGFDKTSLVGGKASETVGLGKVITIVTGGEEKEILLGDDKTTLLLGDYKIDIIAGNVEISTLAGSLEMKNVLGKVKIGTLGDIEVSNPLGSMKIDATGGITMDATLAAKITAMLNVEIKAQILAEFAGQVLTKVGSGSGVTQVNGTLVTLGGAGGLPVARLGDMCIGVGNLGAPVVSNIILGSFKVLSS